MTASRFCDDLSKLISKTKEADKCEYATAFHTRLFNPGTKRCCLSVYGSEPCCGEVALTHIISVSRSYILRISSTLAASFHCAELWAGSFLLMMRALAASSISTESASSTMAKLKGRWIVYKRPELSINIDKRQKQAFRNRFWLILFWHFLKNLVRSTDWQDKPVHELESENYCIPMEVYLFNEERS